MMLEFGSRDDFADPSLGYRRLFGELLGTFMLVLVAAGGGVLHAKGQISLSAAVVAPGLMVMAIILFMGAVSGAHLNPVVSIAFALRGDFPWKRVPGYVVVQLLGATLACLFLLAVLGNVHHLGATLPGPGYQPWQAFLIEIALTGTLVSVILGTASAAQNVGTIGALGGRRLHRAGGAVGGADQRRLDEPRPLVRSGARQRRLDVVLGVRRRSADRGGDRGRLRRRSFAAGAAIRRRGHGGVRIAAVVAQAPGGKPPARRTATPADGEAERRRRLR